MAKKEATLLLQIKQKGQEVIGGLKVKLENLKTAALAVIATMAAVGTAFGKLALDAEKFNVVKKSFENLARSQGQDSQKMLDQMKTLSAGTISELELMQKANNALLLGLPVERFGDMLTIARASAKATGQSMDFMLNSIVTGLGRGSKLMLDNLGILVSQETANENYAKSLNKTVKELTDAERKQAFINEALSIGLKNTQAMGDMNESATDKWERMKSTITDAAVSLGTVFIPAAKRTFDTMTELVQTGKNFLDTFNLFDKAQNDSAASSQELTRAIKKQRDEITLLEIEMSMINSGKSDEGGLAGGFGKIPLMKQDIEERKKLIDEYQAKLDAAVEQEKQRDASEVERKKLLTEQKKLEDQAAFDDKAIKDEQELIEKQMKNDREALLDQALQDKKLQILMKQKDAEILNETDKQKKLKLIADKRTAEEKVIQDQRAKNDLEHKKQIEANESNLGKFKKFMNSEEVKGKEQTFSQIASLANAQNKQLAIIGKAAAIASITINTARGVGQALGAFPPPLSFALAGLVGVAGAAQIATVAGVPLADGGIVRATEGGIQATIGEGGQNEAVIPLPDNGGLLGSTINIVVNGGMLGDPASAREFALAVDMELLKLRQDNESLAFDSGVV